LFERLLDDWMQQLREIFKAENLIRGSLVPFRGMAAIVLILFIGLTSLGLVESSWSRTCSANGTFCTCHPDVKFRKAFTNDDGVVNSFGKDPDDNGIDPGYDKNVARCTAEVQDSDKVLIKISNSYPSYTCRFWTKIRNVGKKPLRCKTPVVHAPPELTMTEVDGQSCGVLYPGESEYESFTVHIEQSAHQGDGYQFEIQKKFVEITKGPCKNWHECW
jgi:hypothetical protein